MRVMVTGHRPPRLAGRSKEVSRWLYDKLGELEPDDVMTGMARGVDQIFAHKALSLDIPYICVFPHPRSLNDEESYLLSHAKSTIYYERNYDKRNYTMRDRYMVDHSDVVLVVWDGIPAGGTYVTAEYAKKQGKKVIYFPWRGE